MRLLAFIFCLLAIQVNAQPLWRNFFTTNQNPRVTVVAGSNATVQASTVGTDQRIFTVNSIPPTTVPLAASAITATNAQTGYGIADTNFEYKVKLRNTDAALAKLEITRTNLLRILFLGDSGTVGTTRWPEVLRKRFNRFWMNSGVGWVPYDTGAWPGEIQDHTSRIIAGTWSAGPTNGVSYKGVTSTDIATPASILVASYMTESVLHYFKKPNGGTFELYTNNVLCATVDTSAASWSVAFITNAYNTTYNWNTNKVVVTVAGSDGVSISGIECRYINSTFGNTVRFLNVGYTGTRADHYSTMDSNMWCDAVNTMNPNLAFIMFGVNDKESNVTPSDYSGSMANLVARIRSASTNCDIVCISPMDTGTSATYTMGDYRDALRRSSITNNFVLLDFYDLVGDYASANANGLYENTTHLNDNGYTYLADVVFELIKRRGSWSDFGYFAYNHGFGVGTLAKLTPTSGFNLGFGYNTLQNATNTTSNIGIGANALAIYSGGALGTGGNTAVGVSAMAVATTTRSSTAIGNLALRYLTTGINNTAIGVNSLLATTDGSDNVGIGYDSVKANTSGLYNTGIGEESLLNETTGRYNSGIGHQSGSGLVNGYYNTFLGSGTSSTTGQVYRATAIGYGAQVTGNNQIVIGNPTNTVIIPNILTVTNGIILQGKHSFSTDFTVVTNIQVYNCNGTNQLITLPNCTNSTAWIIYRFSCTNGYGKFILTNANGLQTIRDGTSLSFTQVGIGSPAIYHDGAHWWIASKSKIVFPVAQFSTTTNIPLTAANTAYPVTFNSTDFNNSQGIALGVGTNGFHSKMWITNSGQYEFGPSIVQSYNGNDTIRFWFRKWNTNIANSATPSKGQNGSIRVITVPFIVNVTEPTPFEIWAESDSTGEELLSGTASGNYPAAPSVICPIKRVSDTWP